MRHLPVTAQVYIWGVVVSGGLVLVWLFPTHLVAEPHGLLLTVATMVAILVAETHPIPVSYKTRVSVSAAVYFAALLVLGPGPACWATAIGYSVALVLLGRRWYNVAFNVGTYTLTIAFASLIYTLTVRNDSLVFSAENIPAFILAGAAVFAVNTGLVATVIALRRRRPLWYTWTSIFEQTAAEYSAMVLMGILAALAVYYVAWWGLALIVLPVFIVYYSLRTSQELRVQTIEAVEALADAIDRRDPYTFEHSQRVAEYAERTARQLNLPPEEVEIIRLTARVHDLGKIGVSNEMLYKPEALTTQEQEDFKQHVLIGADIVSRFPRYREGRDILLYHHEWYDGNGYLDGLKGDQIPIGARIIAIADAYDAMTTDRPYRSALPPEVRPPGVARV